MATKLKQLKLQEVSLVDRGANQHAHITLFKRDGDDSLAGKIGEATAALAKSIESIVADSDADKPAALIETFKQYHDHLQTMVPAGVTDAVTAALAASVSKDNEMTEKSEDLAKKLSDAEALVAKVQKENAFLKLSDAHKAYAVEKALSDEDKDAFVAKSDADREAQVKADPVAKKEVELPEDVRKRLEEADDLKKRLAAVEDANAKNEFAKRAVGLGLPEEHGETLRKAHAGDKASIEKLEGFIKGLTEQVRTGKLFDEFGTHKGADTTSPKAKVDAKVDELQKADPSLSRAQAVAKIASDPAQRELWNEYKAAGAAP